MAVSSVGPCAWQVPLAQASSSAHHSLWPVRNGHQVSPSGGPTSLTHLPPSCTHSTFLGKAVRYKGCLSNLS